MDARAAYDALLTQEGRADPYPYYAVLHEQGQVLGLDQARPSDCGTTESLMFSGQPSKRHTRPYHQAALAQAGQVIGEVLPRSAQALGQLRRIPWLLQQRQHELSPERVGKCVPETSQQFADVRFAHNRQIIRRNSRCR